MTSIIRKVIYPFFSNTVKLQDFPSTSRFDISASSTTTESLIWVPGPFDQFESEQTNTDTLEFSDSDRKAYDSQPYNSGTDYNQYGYNSCVESEKCQSRELTEPERLMSRVRHNWNKQHSLKQTKNVTPSWMNHQQERPLTKHSSKKIDSTCAESNVSNTRTNFVCSKSYDNTKKLQNCCCPSKFNYKRSTKTTRFRNNQSLQRTYERSIEQNKFMSDMRLNSKISDCHNVISKRMPEKGKISLGKCKIKCLHNDVKKDILGEHHNFIETPIGSDISTVRSIELESDFVAEKRHVEQAGLEIKTTNESKIRNWRSNEIEAEGNFSCISKDPFINHYFHHTETLPRQTKQPVQPGVKSCLPSKEKCKFRSVAKSKLNIIVEENLEKSHLRPISESSISMKIIKQNLNITNNLVIPIACSIERNDLKCTSDSNVNNNSNTVNTPKGESKKLKNVAGAKKQGLKIALDTKQRNETRLNKTPNCCNMILKENENIITQADAESKRNSKCQERIQQCLTSKPEPKIRTFFNTLHVKNQYLELKSPPELNIGDNIDVPEVVFVDKTKDYPSEQTISTRMDNRVCITSLKINGTSSEQNRTLLMKRINELISPLNNGRGKKENKWNRNVTNQIEKEHSLVNCKLVKSIIIQNPNAFGVGIKRHKVESEDIFKSHCDVYYVNKARNFERKKYVKKVDKEDKFKAFDDVFNEINCRTVYMNKARMFDKNILDMNIK